MFLCGKKSLEKPKLELPREIIEWEILPRLPAKSLPQFMCVCKQWRSLISSCEFTRKNLHYLKNKQSLTHRKVIEIDRLSKTFTTRDCDDLNNHDLTTTRSIPFVNEAQKSEKFREIRFPPLNREYAYYDGSLMLIKGCIHICVATYIHIQETGLIMETDGELWRMDGDRDGWTKVKDFPPTHNHPLTFDEMEDLARNLEANNRREYFTPTRKMLYLETLVSP
ncbi:F-box domain containing protein [Tanacetum coccineum]